MAQRRTKNRTATLLFFLALAMFAACPATAQLAAFNGLCESGARTTATSGLQSSSLSLGMVPACTVTVYLTGTTTRAIIYADNLSTPLGNPFTATVTGSSAPGSWLFWAVSGQAYDVVMSGGTSPNAYTTPVTLTALQAGGGGGGGGVGPGTPPEIPYYNSANTIAGDPLFLDQSATNGPTGQLQYYGGGIDFENSVGGGYVMHGASANGNDTAYFSLENPTGVVISTYSGDDANEAGCWDYGAICLTGTSAAARDGLTRGVVELDANAVPVAGATYVENPLVGNMALNACNQPFTIDPANINAGADSCDISLTVNQTLSAGQGGGFINLTAWGSPNQPGTGNINLSTTQAGGSSNSGNIEFVAAASDNSPMSGGVSLFADVTYGSVDIEGNTYDFTGVGPLAQRCSLNFADSGALFTFNQVGSTPNPSGSCGTGNETDIVNSVPGGSPGGFAFLVNSATAPGSPTTVATLDNTGHLTVSGCTGCSGGSGNTISGTGLTPGSVYAEGPSGLVLAKANSASTLPAICIATTTTTCQISGLFTTSGLTAGAIYYLSPSTAGAITTTKPSTSGQFIQRFGVAHSTTQLLVMPSLDVTGL